MGGFFEGYGVKEARRERIVKWIVLGGVALAVIAGLGYFRFRDWREERQARHFFELLKRKDFQAAYRLWGCDPAKPCRDYNMDRFLEDWGPQAGRDPGTMQYGEKQSCDGGIIQDVRFGRDDTVSLWVNRGDLILSFAPWPVCNPRWVAPAP